MKRISCLEAFSTVSPTSVISLEISQLWYNFFVLPWRSKSVWKISCTTRRISVKQEDQEARVKSKRWWPILESDSKKICKVVTKCNSYMAWGILWQTHRCRREISDINITFYQHEVPIEGVPVFFSSFGPVHMSTASTVVWPWRQTHAKVLSLINLSC